jgi:hypothetical protein
MSFRYVFGLVLVSFAIGVCVLLGTLGWFAVGFGTMTDCTDNYSCSSTGCPPCGDTARWINVGGVVQWLLAAAAITILVRGSRSQRWLPLLGGGAAVLAASLLAFLGTTLQASESYCRPGTAGYESSYCSVDA